MNHTLRLLEEAKNALINSGYAETHPLIQDIVKELDTHQINQHIESATI